MAEFGRLVNAAKKRNDLVRVRAPLPADQVIPKDDNLDRDYGKYTSYIVFNQQYGL